MRNVLIFSVGNYRYGLPVEQVKEIIRIAAFKPLPDQPPFVEGVINLRGNVIPLIDFRRRFLMGTTEKSVDKRIIICRINKFIIGFLVDVVDEVHLFEDSLLRDVSNENLGLEFKFVDKIAIYNNELISILIPENIFSREEIDKLINFFDTAVTNEKIIKAETVSENPVKVKLQAEDKTINEKLDIASTRKKKSTMAKKTVTKPKSSAARKKNKKNDKK